MCLTVCRGAPIWIRLWGFGVTPYGSDCRLGCPHVGLSVGLGVGVSLWGWREVRGSGWPHMAPAMGFWGDPVWV